MSEPPIHIAVVLIDLEEGGRSATYQPPAGGDASGPILIREHQGPLGQGEHVEIGSVATLLAHGRRRLGDADGAARETEAELAVRIVGFVGSGAGLVGAIRRFRIRGPIGHERVIPMTPLPELRAGRRFEREVRRWLEESYALDERRDAGHQRGRIAHGTAPARSQR